MFVVGDSLAAFYSSGTLDDARLTRCQAKYVAVWPRLQTLAGSSCEGLPRFLDNLDGTVTDNLTGLTWEKKSDDGSVHDKDDLRSWGFPENGNGPAYTTFLRDGLNAGAGFAGANDWRLPTFAELQTIVLPAADVGAAFNTGCVPGCSSTGCSCTQIDGYWSATTAPTSSYAWLVSFFVGTGAVDSKSSVHAVRAVRGGW